MTTSPRTVGDVMTRTVVAVGRTADLEEIVDTLRQWKVSALPVLVGDGRVVGVVTEADLPLGKRLRAGGPTEKDRGHRFSDLDKPGADTAAELMTTPSVCAHAGTTLAQAARIMSMRRVERLPVTDPEGRLSGMVSRHDLLTGSLREDEEIAEEVRHEVLEAVFPGATTVTAEVREGTVRFTGRVRNPDLMDAVVRRAREIEGVVDVESDLRGPT